MAETKIRKKKEERIFQDYMLNMQKSVQQAIYFLSNFEWKKSPLTIACIKRGTKANSFDIEQNWG